MSNTNSRFKLATFIVVAILTFTIITRCSF